MNTHYIGNGSSLKLDESLCSGCGTCTQVCPHAVFQIVAKKAAIRDRESCMECGACAKNCPAGALSVKAGVGCAAAIINGMLTGQKPSCGCNAGNRKPGECC